MPARSVGIEAMNFYGGTAYLDVYELAEYRKLDMSRFENLLMKQRHISDGWSMPKIILLSWLIAGVEYCFLIPANNIGSDITGGPFNLMQLKVIQEVISISVFTVIAMMCFQGQQLHWNHVAAFICLIAAVCFVFYK